jgi:hypothetical protein
LTERSEGTYHDDFLMPGIIPSFANSLKQILHKSKSRIYPLFLPQRKHRLTTRDLYFGVFSARAITDVLAMFSTIQKTHYFASYFPPLTIKFLQGEPLDTTYNINLLKI